MYIIKGTRFNKVVVLSDVPVRSTGKVWVVCDCGKKVKKQIHRLADGRVHTCFDKHHGFSTTHPKLLGRWKQMIRRCHDLNYYKYKNHGGRGIEVCKSWRDDFLNFFVDMGEPPFENSILDRIDNNLGYFKDNCRWTTSTVNGRNKSTNRLLTLFNETKCVTEWIEDPRCPLSYDYQIRNRLNQGWSEYDAVTKPMVLRGRK